MAKTSQDNNEKNKALTKANSEEQNKQAERQAQMSLAIGGFGAFGLLVGLLWGANHMVPQVDLANALSQAAKVGCLIATNTANWAQGGVMGSIGAAIGAAFGYSLFLSRRSA